MQMSLPFWRPLRAAPPTPLRRPAAEPAGWFSRDEVHMGTAVRVELWAPSRRAADAAIDAVMAEMRRIERCYSPYRADSELSRLNRGAARAPFTASAELYDLLQRALAFSAISGGAFDITYAAVGRLFDYRRGVAPDAAALVRARACVGWQQLQLDPQRRSVRFAREGMAVDLGGFAKGHAVERGAAILRAMGVEHAIVTAGGDSRVLGDRRGRLWSVAVRHPRRPGEVVAVLPLADVAVSTSGDYERFFERDGVRHHHLLDPATGRSPDQVHSVTVVAPDGLTSEALSKTVFVLGAERGLALAARVPGVDVVVVDATGALHASAGLQAA